MCMWPYGVGVMTAALIVITYNNSLCVKQWNTISHVMLALFCTM